MDSAVYYEVHLKYFRNFAHSKTSRQRSIVVESKAYTCPSIPNIFSVLLERAVLVSLILSNDATKFKTIKKLN